MNQRPIFLLFALSCLAPAAGAAGISDTIWLSDSPPRQAKAPAGHSHDSVDSVFSGEEADTTHKGVKHLWLRLGDDPLRAAHADSTAGSAVTLLDLRGRRTALPAKSQSGKFHVQADLAEMGFYNAYMVRQSVRDDTLWVRTAKAELLKGTCCKKDVEEEATKAVIDAAAPLELVREHMPDEALFTRIVSGDKLSFQVLSQGKPVAGVPVTMITQMGWRKTASSGPDGRAAFTVIRDYYPPWLEFKKRYKETFLVVAEREVAQAGEHEGTKYAAIHYQTTLAGKYMPAPYDYRSYAWGLGLGLGVLVFGGLAVYLYRRRRLRPFKEVRLDEKD